MLQSIQIHNIIHIRIKFLCFFVYNRIFGVKKYIRIIERGWAIISFIINMVDCFLDVHVIYLYIMYKSAICTTYEGGVTVIDRGEMDTKKLSEFMFLAYIYGIYSRK